MREHGRKEGKEKDLNPPSFEVMCKYIVFFCCVFWSSHLWPLGGTPEFFLFVFESNT